MTLYLINLINISLFSFLIKLYTNKSHLSIAIVLSTILMSIFSKDTILKWLPFSASMSIRIKEIIGRSDSISLWLSASIILLTSVLLLILSELKVKKLELL
jgi:hypothetical protein